MNDWITLHFDEKYYLEQHMDVLLNSEDAFEYFLTRGQALGHLPNKKLECLKPIIEARMMKSTTPTADVLRLFPLSVIDCFHETDVLMQIENYIQPEFYAQVVGDSALLDSRAALIHYLTEGAFKNIRPTLFFHNNYYQSVLREAANSNPTLVHPNEENNLFCHWVTIGRLHRIVPTPLFDGEYYLALHKDLGSWKGWIFDHYIRHGCREEFRKASPHLDHPKLPGTQKTILLRHLIGPDVKFCEKNSLVELGNSSEFEDSIIKIYQFSKRLNTEPIRSLVQHAAAIEPMIHRPHTAFRIFQVPPKKHTLIKMFEGAETIRRLVPFTVCDTIVLVPHCRMAGSARVAGTLTNAIQHLYPESKILIVTTELSDFERPDWFPDNVPVFDLSEIVKNYDQENKIRLLLDLVRGLNPKRVINVNSALGWNFYTTYGSQISKEILLHAYLFTWDLDINGNKGGYPITAFQSCFSFLTAVFVDNTALKAELEYRYVMPPKLQQRIHVLHTPAQVGQISYSSIFENKAKKSRKRMRALWAGRFDRQKRFDLVVQIVNLMPELEVLAWGKQVLGGSDIDFSRLPSNIKLMGTYDEFYELPFESADFFLYTSEWDGLPTILIDVGLRGLPTIASEVGGISDLITTKTGYPVTDALNPKAYVDTIAAMIANPAEVTRRATEFRQRTEELCSWTRYIDRIHNALQFEK